MLNDTLQSLIPAIYPVLKSNYDLTFVQIGLITLVYQMTASLLQPMVGAYTDKHPKAYSLAAGMACTLVGLLFFSQAGSFTAILLSVGMVGIGSSVFHPEASKVAFMAAGERHGFAQSLFQVGGNFGTSLGPLLAAWIVVPHGQGSMGWFSVLALLAIFVLYRVGRWYGVKLRRSARIRKTKAAVAPQPVSGRILFAMLILTLLVISKYFYLVSLTNYYTFYLIHKFGVSVQGSQIFLFIFLFSVAAGTIAGGPLGDRYGRKIIIWISILGTAPFSLALPHVGLVGVAILSVFAGGILASAFSVILVYAQELLPGRVGMIAGMFFGFAFGVSGIAAAVLGELIDRTSIEFVFNLCAYLPLMGILTWFLPNIHSHHIQPQMADETQVI